MDLSFFISSILTQKQPMVQMLAGSLLRPVKCYSY